MMLYQASTTEHDFKTYLKNTLTQIKTKRTDDAIIKIIKDLNEKIPFELKEDDSLLQCNDINKLQSIKKMLNGGELNAFNDRESSGHPSMSIKAYISFLKTKNNGINVKISQQELKIIDDLEISIELLESLPINKILYGPPGTGKTYKLQELQKSYDKDKYVTVTFHQSYGYEDFVEGLKANINEHGDVYYKVENGIFKDICEKAEENLDDNYAIFIDEINRGNISKIFGELITLIEISKRGMELQLPYSKELFSVPKNLSIIGTMNTADRSIAVLDTALRRRFEFQEMMPEPYHEKISQNINGINVQKLFAKINERVEFLYDRDHTIGHAYFIDCDNFVNLQDIFKKKIIPLLQEYFYDDWEKINLIFNNNGFIKFKKYKQNELFSNCKNFEEFEDDKIIYSLDNATLKKEERYIQIYAKIEHQE